jgi:hypothetical protein
MPRQNDSLFVGMPCSLALPLAVAMSMIVNSSRPIEFS